MRITAKHYYYFGDQSDSVGKNLISPDSWDIVRINDNGQDNPFSIPKNRDLWIKKSQDETMQKRAFAINNFIIERNYERINSFGVGCGFIEYNLKKKNPKIFLSCSDFAERSAKRLREVFLEADAIETFDILNGNWKNHGDKTLSLLYRIDNELDNKQWDLVFGKMSSAKIKEILFVPCEVSTIKDLVRRKASFLYQKIKGRKMSFAGYLRTKDQIKALFEKYYKIEKEISVFDLTGFFLIKK